MLRIASKLPFIASIILVLSKEPKWAIVLKQYFWKVGWVCPVATDGKLLIMEISQL